MGQVEPFPKGQMYQVGRCWLYESEPQLEEPRITQGLQLPQPLQRHLYVCVQASKRVGLKRLDLNFKVLENPFGFLEKHHSQAPNSH